MTGLVHVGHRSDFPNPDPEGVMAYATNEDVLYIARDSAWIDFESGRVKSLVFADSPYTLTAGVDLVLADTTDGAIVINLPAAAVSAGRRLRVIKTSGGTNTVTVDGNAAETINGAATQVFEDQYDNVVIVCNGALWLIESRVAAD